MATFVTDVVDIPELVGYARERVELNAGLLAGIVPVRVVDDLEFELLNLEVNSRQVARFRSFDTPNMLGKRPGFAVVRGEILPLGLSMRLNEKEIKTFTKLRQGVPDGTDGDIYDDVAITADACAVRQEIVRADLLTDGVVTISENGVTATGSYPVPGGHFISPATPWSTTATAVPVTDLLAAEAVYRAANGGRNPAAWLMSSAVIGNLTINTQIRNLAYATSPTVPSFITQATVTAVFNAMGVQAPIVPFDETLPDASGVEQPAINARKVIGIRPGVAELFVGTSPSAELLVGRGLIRRQDAAGVICFVTEEIVPANVTTTSEALTMGVLRDPNGLMVLTV